MCGIRVTQDGAKSRSRSISGTGSATRFVPVLLWVFVFSLPYSLSACAVPSFRAAGIADQDNSRLAVLENRWGCTFCVKGIWKDDGTVVYEFESPAYFEAFYLMPGRYEILYESYAYDLLFSRRDMVDLRAGKRYRVMAEHPYLARNYAYFWIEDRSSGQVVAGQRP